MQVEKKAPRIFRLLTGRDSQKHPILIVEDNPDLLSLLHEILSESHEVATAANGEEAYEILLEKPDHFHLVISDIMMPVAAGYALLNKVRSHPRLGFLPFLFLSALSAHEHHLKAFRLGVDAFISKPFETMELKVRVDGILRNQKLRRSFAQAPKSNNPSAAAGNLLCSGV